MKRLEIMQREAEKGVENGTVFQITYYFFYF